MKNKMRKVYSAVDALVDYAKENLLLDPRNEIYVRNTVLDLIGAESYEQTDARCAGRSCTALLNDLHAACEGAGFYTAEEREHRADAVMGALSLSPKDTEEEFARRLSRSSEEATKWFYDYAVLSDYVKKEKLDQNPRFEHDGLVITVNLAKPEFRDPKKAASGNATKGGYPKCTICRENEGFAGRDKRTLRTVTLKLGGGDWFWQFSPYGYFYQHGIAVNCLHTPMHVDEHTFVCLMDFVDLFPHWFIGCNAPLPRIGGSVLAHDHFQGGGEVLPLHRAACVASFKSKRCPDATVGVLDWAGTAVRVTSANREAVAKLSDLIRAAWEQYEDAARGIVPFDGDGAHNAVSPTVVKKGGMYEMTLILRSNATSERYPDGIFHAHPEFHIIKKESIGLIEAQGLFILPGRLKAQFETIEELLVNGAPLSEELKEFEMIYGELRAMRPTFTKEQAHRAVQIELASVCTRILQNTAVFETFADTENFLKGLDL